jgi:hypothetical protein
LRLNTFLFFIVAATVISIPAVYQVPNPVGHGTGIMEITIIGSENVKLLNYSTVVVNTVRLACGANAEYDALVTLNFSNAAGVPINATVLFNSSYAANGQQIDSTPLVFQIPANSTDYSVSQHVPTQVSVQNAPVLPTLSFQVGIAQVSNATIDFKVPKTLSLIKYILQPKGVEVAAMGG